MNSAFVNCQIEMEQFRKELSGRIKASVFVDYGEADEGQQYASFSVERLPAGSWGRPGPLLTLVTGTGVPSGTFAPLDAEGVPLGLPSSLLEALKAGRFPAVRTYREMSDGAFCFRH